MGEDFERERQDYFDRISGVGEWQGQRFGWSRWAWDVAWHPAMLKGRSDRPAKGSPWDPLKPVLFLTVVLGVPALIVFLTASGMSLGAKLIIVLGAAAGIVVVAVLAAQSAMRRARTAPKAFPHPGPKGHHAHKGKKRR